MALSRMFTPEYAARRAFFHQPALWDKFIGALGFAEPTLEIDSIHAAGAEAFGQSYKTDMATVLAGLKDVDFSNDGISLALCLTGPKLLYKFMHALFGDFAINKRGPFIPVVDGAVLTRDQVDELLSSSPLSPADYLDFFAFGVIKGACPKIGWHGVTTPETVSDNIMRLFDDPSQHTAYCLYAIFNAMNDQPSRIKLFCMCHDAQAKNS